MENDSSSLPAITASSVIIGSRILSIRGETADLENGHSYTTLRNIVGIIGAILQHQSKCYILTFPEHYHVTVMLSADDLHDESRYIILPERRVVQRAIDMHDSFAHIPDTKQIRKNLIPNEPSTPFLFPWQLRTT